MCAKYPSDLTTDTHLAVLGRRALPVWKTGEDIPGWVEMLETVGSCGCIIAALVRRQQTAMQVGSRTSTLVRYTTSAAACRSVHYSPRTAVYSKFIAEPRNTTYRSAHSKAGMMATESTIKTPAGAQPTQPTDNQTPSTETIASAAQEFKTIIDDCLSADERVLVKKACAQQKVCPPGSEGYNGADMMDFTDLLNQVQNADKFLTSLEEKSDNILKHIDDMLVQVEDEWKEQVGDETDVLKDDFDPQSEINKASSKDTAKKPF